jgi:hypothetical protein
VDARQSRRGKRISLRQEKSTAADLGGHTTAGSGAAKFSGGADVRVMGKTRVECKYTENSDYVLKFTELEKLRKQAQKQLEYPVFQFAFKDPSGRLEKYAVIQWDEMETPKVEWSTESKSMILRKHALWSAMTIGLTRVIFHVKGENSLRSKYYRVMTWDQYVERHNANA